MLFRLFACILLLCSFISEAKHSVVLELTPNNCVVEKVNNICHLALETKWQSEQHLDVCLFLEDKKVTCWKKTKSVHQVIQISLKQTSVATIRDTGNKVLASTQIKVSSAQPVAYRRRLRSDWSLF